MRSGRYLAEGHVTGEPGVEGAGRKATKEKK